jgi:glucose-1-phosphate thymidylyltransferase
LPNLYAIVLAGGYATRLWPLTLYTPKALLPIAGKPILDYIMDKLEAMQPPLTRIVLSTNDHFQQQFKEWLAFRNYKKVVLLPDISDNEGQKPGAIKAMANIITSAEEDDVMVLAGDGMFNDGLLEFLTVFKKRKETVVALYEAASFEEAKRCATVNVDGDDKIIDFTEKPSQPTTKMVCGAVYLFKKGVNRQLRQYLALRLPTDQSGRFIEWLCRQAPVYGYTLKDPLWDIGTPESYKACNEYFCNLK